jgi:hypothetical protein
MPFVTAARNFLANQGEFTTTEERYRGQMIETVRYLLDNAVGIDNAISTNRIIEHLRHEGFRTYREGWQINVLGALRDRGIFIASKRGKGMYIIETTSDCRAAIRSIEDRIEVENARLNTLRRLCREANFIT